MKNLLFWRRVDFWGQMLMLLPLIAIVSEESRRYAMFVYLSLGTWHLLSCIINAIARPQPASPARRGFNLTAAWILGVFAFCAGIAYLISKHSYGGAASDIAEFFGATALIEACFMLVGGPVMAIWYFSITLEEIDLVRGAIHHRSEVHWKL